MKRRLFNSSLCAPLVAVVLLAGCSTARPGSTTVATSAQHAECLVCKHNADLACVDVEVDGTTPRTVYGGTTYYFCSEHCLHKFEKAPATYVGR